jgi:hypothetical protein
VPGWLPNTVPVTVVCSMKTNWPVEVFMTANAVAGPVP